MIVWLYIVIAAVIGYFVGNVNFARVFTWHFTKKDITKEGSQNPGTMNMLRTQGFGKAMLTLACDALKLGGPALACFFLFNHFFTDFGNIAYFAYAIACILGHCFPVIYKFKGGKGVACTFGMFLFHPTFWWLALILFAICFVLFFFIPYGFVINLSFILAMNVYVTCFYVLNQTLWWVPLIALIWLNFALVVFLHRGNIKRLLNGTENKVDFKAKVFEKLNRKKVQKVEAAKESHEENNN